MNEDKQIEATPAAQPEAPAASRKGWARPAVAVTAGAALLVVGLVAGAGATRMMGHSETQVLLEPVAINTLADDSVVAVKGKVAEIFGNKFIIQDASGRALVETGPAGDDGDLVARDETVTVQGRYEDGFLHGSAIVGADGKMQSLGPLKGPRPPHGPREWLRHIAD